MIIKIWLTLIAILAFTLTVILIKENKNIENSTSEKLTYIFDVFVFSIIGILSILSFFNMFNILAIELAFILYIIVHAFAKCSKLLHKKQQL